MTFSSRHASLAVVALLGTVATLAANPRPAEACGPLTGERCGDLRAADGEGKPLPANATLVALESRMARDDSSLPRVEHSVSLTALDGIDPITERPLTFAAEDEAGVFLVRTGGLVVGERYEFRYDGYCAGDAATFSTVFVAEEQAPVPSEAGVLSVRETFEQPPSGNPCSADDTVSNAVVYFDLIANETFDRFRGVARLHTFVDGEPYSSTEYGGTRALGIRTRCVGGELSLGEHVVTVTAEVPDFGTTAPTPPLTILLDCPSEHAEAGCECPDTGCSCEGASGPELGTPPFDSGENDADLSASPGACSVAGAVGDGPESGDAGATALLSACAALLAWSRRPRKC